MSKVLAALRAVRQDVPPPRLRRADVHPEARRPRPRGRHPLGPPHGGDHREAVAPRADSTPTSACSAFTTCWTSRSRRSTSTSGSTCKVKKQMEKAQKEYYLNEKIKAIHQELGRKDDRGDELDRAQEKIEKAGLPKDVKEKAEQELKRLEAMPPVSAEATVSRNYIDWLVSVPWRKRSKRAEGPRKRREDPERGPLRPGEDQGPHPRVPGRAPARGADQELDHLLRRARPASASPPSPSRSPAPPAASSCACRWAACATRPRSAATGAPTSAPSRDRSSR